MSQSRLALSVLSILCLSSSALADVSNLDWINIEYALRTPANARSATRDAQSAIIRNAETWSKEESYTVTKTPVLPASGDPHDYYSWAPYWWPECNWCPAGKGGHSHLAYPNPDTNQDGSPKDHSSTDGNSNSGQDPPDDDQDPSDSSDSSDFNSDVQYESVEQRHLSIPVTHRSRMKRTRRHESLPGSPLDLTSGILGSQAVAERPSAGSNATHGLGGVGKVLPQDIDESDPSNLVPSAVDSSPDDALASATSDPAVQTSALGQPETLVSTTTSTTSHPAATYAPGRHAGKAPSEKPSKTTSSKGKCTPSPTKRMAPSATWTTCPYGRNDGALNPDVRQMTAPGAIQHVSEAVHQTTIAFAIQNDHSFAQNAVRFVKAFFLDAETRMNPNMDFAQRVRGPGQEHEAGTFGGILDFRGIVKIVNGLTILKASACPDWTPDLEQAMKSWFSTYVSWLTDNPMGQYVSERPNNHNTFYVAQVAAIKLYLGDKDGAASTLQHFFDHEFRDQIAASGEQPFEAKRARPQHYRAFNLQALITNAKLGDQVGKNLWVAQSRYGATIQTAVDYAMKQAFDDGEEPTDLTPHVAVIAAQYGDPTGKYAAFLKRNEPKYQSQPYWFFDQPAAFKNSKSKKRAVQWARDDESIGSRAVPFECPGVFSRLGPQVEVDVGLYFTCADLRDLYERS